MAERRGLFGRRLEGTRGKPTALGAKQFGSTDTGTTGPGGEYRSTRRVPVDERFKIFRQNPLYRKGVVKHSGDLVREDVEILDAEGEVDHELTLEFKAWCRDVGLKKTMRDAFVQAHVANNGIVELVYDDDGDADSEVPETARLVDVVPLPRKTTNLRVVELEDGSIRLGAVHRPFRGSKVLFHPDRVHVFEVHPDPESPAGLSTAEAAYQAALSWIQGDQSLGEIIRHHGPGFKDATVKGGDPETLKTLKNVFESPEMIRGLAHDESVEIQDFQASDMDVAPYYDAMAVGIAAALGMDVLMLKGVEAGEVSGSRTNRTNYQDSIVDGRVMNVDPFYSRVIEGALRPGRPLDHRWKPFPSDPSDEASIFRERALGVESLVRSGVPLRDAVKESRLEIDVGELPDSPGPDENGFLPFRG